MKPDARQKTDRRAGPSTSVEAVLADPTLSRQQKIDRLFEMIRDAEALEVASGEGMPGPASGLQRVHRALRELGVEDPAAVIHPKPPQDC
jgi:hypothetical protein